MIMLLSLGRRGSSAFLAFPRRQRQWQQPAGAGALARAAARALPNPYAMGRSTSSSSSSSRSSGRRRAGLAAAARSKASSDEEQEEEEEEEDNQDAFPPPPPPTLPTRVPNAIKPGTVYFVATPLGNLGDMTLRALDVLRGVDLIAAEDTRTTGLLLKALGLEKKPQVSHHQHNVAGRVPDLVRRARDERLSIAVVSDAGTPGVSDPGSELAAACWAAGVPLVPVPGACAAVAAVSVAGFASTEFVFVGFLPAKSGKARRAKVAEVVAQERPCVLYEAPHRVLRTLTELAQADGDGDRDAGGGGDGGEREVLCARELTKLHEELFKGTIAEAVAHFEAKPPRGEFTLVLGPRRVRAGGAWAAGASVEEKGEAAVGLLRGLIGGQGLSASEAAKRVAKEVGLSKGEVYKMALALKEEEEERGKGKG
jgi:16S rRNA (cytidine1402-2'-O)-methyltransferase